MNTEAATHPPTGTEAVAAPTRPLADTRRWFVFIAKRIPRPVLSLVVAAAALLLIVGFAYDERWRPHLQVDAVTFQHRAVSFLDDYSWQSLGHNEYQPGALWFFVATGWLAAQPTSFDAFVTSLILVNVALLGAHGWLIYAFGQRHAWILFWLIAIATGPILLYRFELLVSLLVIGAWLMAQRQKWFMAAGAFLGMAVAVKVYPVLLLPLLLAEAVRQKSWRAGGNVCLGFAAGGLVLTLPYLLLGGDLAGVQQSLEFHRLKPIGLEGVWGSVIPLVQQALDIPLRMTPGYGVHGFSSDLPLLSAELLNWLWVVPYGSLLAASLWAWRRRGYLDFGLALALLLVFVLIGKVVNPQYLWWFAVLLPLVPPGWFRTSTWWLVGVSTVVGLGLTQLIYPLNYSEFLGWFNGETSDSSLFWLNVGRNGLWLVVMIVVLGAFSRRGWQQKQAVDSVSAAGR